VVNGQKVEEKREDEVVYIGRQYQMPNRAKGKNVYKIKITETGVMKTDEAGHSDSIYEVPGPPKEILEGAFFRSTGKKLKFNFQNNSGAPLYVITGSKWSFDAYDIPAEGELLIKISNNKFGLVEKNDEKPGSREMTATMFEVFSLGEIQISKQNASFIAKLIRPGHSEELSKKDAKMFKDKENWTKKDVASFVMKGVTIVFTAVGIGMGVAGVVAAAGGVADVASTGVVDVAGAGADDVISQMHQMAVSENITNVPPC